MGVYIFNTETLLKALIADADDPGELGADEIGSGVAALSSGAVAKAAVGGEDLLSALDGGGIRNGAADEHVAARACGRRGRCGGLGGKRCSGEKE